LIKTFTEVTIQEVVDATRYENSRSLRERVRKLAKTKLGEGAALVKLQALLVRCGRATDKRNDVIHSLWAYELDGEHKIQADDHSWKLPPTIDQLNDLFGEIEKLIQDIIFARAEGFIFEAAKKVI